MASGWGTKRNTPLSAEHHQVIDGLMLGDGSMCKRGTTPSIVITSIHKEYLESIASSMPFCFQGIYTREAKESLIKGRAVNLRACHSLRSLCDQTLIPLYDRWYPSGKKIVPADMKLTPLALLHWFYGDGRTSMLRHSPNYKSVVMSFATNGFTTDECEFLASCMRQLDPEMIFQVQNHGAHKILSTQRIASVCSVYRHILPIFESASFAYKIKIPPLGKKTYQRTLEMVSGLCCPYVFLEGK